MKIRGYVLTVLMLAACLSGCGVASGGQEKAAEENAVKEKKEENREEAENQETEKKGLAHETAGDGHIDFEVLQEENPEIFAWIYVSGTGIDYPILQSAEADDYYETHLAERSEGNKGALYTEMANLMNMCDFNTIIHGRDEKEDDLFFDLHRFEEPDFFAEQENFYIYLPDNVLTYEIFAAYYDDGSDILRRHDYTTYEGCQKHLEEIYGHRSMNRNIRDGWEDLTPANFLVTLNGNGREGQQYVVIGALVGDAAGKIDRVILE